jgi:hypothetical protein
MRCKGVERVFLLRIPSPNRGDLGKRPSAVGPLPDARGLASRRACSSGMAYSVPAGLFGSMRASGS